MKVLAALLLAAVCLLAVPVAACAATFTVDALGDQPDETPGSNGCKTAGNTCTLRAAIQEANFVAAEDTIKFDATFSGQVADSIALGSSLPAIKFPLTIDGDAGGTGGQCTTEAGPKGPCVEVTGPTGGAALIVENANEVAIEGLALTGQTGGGSAIIDVIDSSEEFRAADNWLGVRLDGTSSGDTKGIYLDPGSDKAVIGGVNASERNVIANIEFEGLDIEGASEATIQGNYFGVKPDGSTAAPNSKNIEITDTVAFEATDNEVGATVANGTAPCDGGCNVIAAAAAGPLSSGIDLQGNGVGQNEEPATGPTTVHGNFIGLNAAGTATVANSIGVNVGEATDAVIGGSESGDANFIAGGSEGVFATNSEGLKVIGNTIGAGAAGAEITAPAKGVWLLNITNSNPVAVSGNVFHMDGGVGVEARFGGTEIADNFIEGAEFGVLTKVGPNAAGGNLIEDNVIGESLASGIRIEDKNNEVLGNAVYKSAGPGILLELPVALLFPTENLIGGNAATDENNINESGGPAIKIVDESGNPDEDSFNEVGRNRGAKNAGLFIDLIGAANAGILPPAIAVAKQSEASGSAEPGARIRVFRKKAAESGELESFLEETVADGSGNWKVTYPASIPGGTVVAATQTSEEGGTSELSTATTVADPSKGGEGDKEKPKGSGPRVVCLKRSSGCGGKPKQPKPTPALDTTIQRGPRGAIHSTTAKFKFSSTAKGAKFECKLDRRKFKPCKSPVTYKGLKPGKHVFKVRAVKGKAVDPTPAKRKFKVIA